MGAEQELPRSQERLAADVARVKGEDSNAGQALAEFIRRRAGGEDVIVYPLRGRWLVASAREVGAEVRVQSGRSRDTARASSERTSSRLRRP